VFLVNQSTKAKAITNISTTNTELALAAALPKNNAPRYAFSQPQDTRTLNPNQMVRFTLSPANPLTKPENRENLCQTSSQQLMNQQSIMQRFGEKRKRDDVLGLIPQFQSQQKVKMTPIQTSTMFY